MVSSEAAAELDSKQVGGGDIRKDTSACWNNRAPHSVASANHYTVVTVHTVTCNTVVTVHTVTCNTVVT